MRNISLLLIVLLCLPIFNYAQDWEKIIDGRIQTLNTDNVPFNKEHVLYKNGDKYFYFSVFYGSAAVVKLDETNTYKNDKVETPGYKKLVVASFLNFNGNLYQFFWSKISSDDGTKNGFYVGKYNSEKNEFEDVQLLEEFDSDTKFELIMRQSDNNKYIGFCINPTSKKNVQTFSLLMLDADMNKISVLKKSSVTFSNEAQIYDFRINNDGCSNIFFTENAQTFDKATSFQSNGNFLYMINLSAGSDKPLNHEIVLDGKKILHAKIMDAESSSELFISWCKEDASKNVGFSKYNLNTKTEEIIYEFDSEILEPFIMVTGRLESYTYRDAKEKKNENSTTTINASLDLITQFSIGDEEYYLLQKNTPILNYDAQSGNKWYQYMEGDIFLLNSKKNMLKKIERCVITPGAPRGMYLVKNESQLTLYYYSIPPDFVGDVKAKEPATTMNQSKVFEDYHLYKTVFDLNTLEFTSHEIKVFEENATPRLIYFSTIHQNGLSKLVWSHAHGDYQIFELKE